jgi:hypothetical protein
MQMGMKSYRDYAPARSGLDGLSGFHVKNPSAPHSTQFLAWEKGATVFRPYPMIENGQELPWRISDEQSHFTLWMMAARMAKMMGVNDKFTCFTNIKGRDPRDLGPIDKFSDCLHRAIGKNARSFPESWEMWVKGRPGQGAKIPRIDNYGLLQGMLFETAGKTFKGQDGRPRPLHPVLLCLSKSARIALQALCNDEVPGYQGPPEDYAKRFKCGDFLSSAGGRFLRFYHVPSSDNVRPHYGLEFLQACPLPPGLVSKEWLPWEQLLTFLTEEEQLGLLVSHFPAEPLDYAFRDTQYADKLPAHVRGSYARMQATQVAPGYVPGMYPPGYAPAPAAPAPAPVYPAAPMPPPNPAAYVPHVPPYVPPPAAFAAPVAAPVPPPVAAPAPAYAPVQPPTAQIDFGDSEEDAPPFRGGASAEAAAPSYPSYQAPAPTGAVAAGVPMAAWASAPPQASAPAAVPGSQPNGDPSLSERSLADARARLRGAATLAQSAPKAP